MKKNIVRQVLESYGPCISSELAERIKRQNPSMSSDAIRKMISRSTDIGKLPFLRFSHNRRFIYLKDDFGSFKFWRALKKCMREANSAYSHAILSVINNGGYLKVKDFGIVSGSPIKQAKHLSYESVLKNLLSAKILRSVYIDGVGDCVLINNNIANDISIFNMANCESFFDKPIFELIKAWLRNLGIVAFNQIKTKKVNSLTDDRVLKEVMRLGALQKKLFIDGKRVGDREYAEVLIAITEYHRALLSRLMAD